MVTRVGVYFDGFNVYYGGRSQFGRNQPGWRWYSPRLLAENVLADVRASGFYSLHNKMQQVWGTVSLDPVVFCTARIHQLPNPQSFHDQDAFLRAIESGNHTDHVEYGRFVSRIKTAPLATLDSNGTPIIQTATWPIQVQDIHRNIVQNATFLVSHLHNEEKGSDVNVATHMLKDALDGRIDAAILFSNDSDLKLPVAIVRSLIPVGIVNPSHSIPHNSLIDGTDHNHGDWHRYLRRDSFTRSQMPDPAGAIPKPAGW